MLPFWILAFFIKDQAHKIFNTPYCIHKDNEVISPDSMITELICFKWPGTVITNSCLSSLILNSHGGLNHLIICCISQELKKYQLLGMTWTLCRDVRKSKLFFSSLSVPKIYLTWFVDKCSIDTILYLAIWPFGCTSRIKRFN